MYSSSQISKEKILEIMKNRKTVLNLIRRTVFLLLTAAMYILQCTLIPRTAFPFPVFLLIPLTLSVSMFEYEFSGLFFGLFAGALWDLASPLPDGLLAFLFALLAAITGLLSHYVLRNTLLGALLITAAASSAYSFISLLFYSSSMDIYDFRNVLISHYLPSVIISVILTVPFYFSVRALSAKLRHDKIIT